MKNDPQKSAATPGVSSLSEVPQYTSANYAGAGDIVFLTRAKSLLVNFDATGENAEWNYRSLTDISQRQLTFTNEKAPSSGIAAPPVNQPVPKVEYLKTTTDIYFAIGASTLISDISGYYTKSESALRLLAVSAMVDENPADGEAPELPVTKFINAPTGVMKYKFPFSVESAPTVETYQIDRTFGSDELKIMPVMMREITQQLPDSIDYLTLKGTISRNIVVDGMGTLSTPYMPVSDLTETMRLVTETHEVLTLTVYWTDQTQEPRIIEIDTRNRELAWFHNTFNFPLLLVNQVSNDGSTWRNLKVEYYDEKKNFEADALFVNTPFRPEVNDKVTMQNLSSNATGFHWTITDAADVLLYESDSVGISYVFPAEGEYSVTLVAKNEISSDEFSRTVKVSAADTGERHIGSYLNDLAALKKVSVYPKKARNFLVVTHLPLHAQLGFYDARGNCQFTQHAQRIVDVSSLKPGVYKLMVNNGKYKREFEFAKA